MINRKSIRILTVAMSAFVGMDAMGMHDVHHQGNTGQNLVNFLVQATVNVGRGISNLSEGIVDALQEIENNGLEGNIRQKMVNLEQESTDLGRKTVSLSRGMACFVRWISDMFE